MNLKEKEKTAGKGRIIDIFSKCNYICLSYWKRSCRLFRKEVGNLNRLNILMKRYFTSLEVSSMSADRNSLGNNCTVFH